MHKFLLVLLAAGPVPAQLPDFYKSVDRVTWVVGDVGRVADAWSKLGFVKILNRGDVVSAKIRDLQVEWVQPTGGRGAYAAFLKSYGDGIFSLVHRVPSVAALDQELERLRGLGINVLERQKRKDGVQLAYLDTVGGGKYALGLVYDPAAPSSEPPPPPAERINQFAFVARDPQAVSAAWQKIGLPALACNPGKLGNQRYRDKPGDFAQDLCWQRHGRVPYEWIVTHKGPDIFEEHLKAHGEGPQHLGFPVEDMDKAIAEWRAWGYPVAQSGSWGEEGKPRSGRFAYVDTATIGGVFMELLWNFR
jgi:catechol 2,3-dioxygenase-like lactoylglutathione lyase family enzyme